MHVQGDSGAASVPPFDGVERVCSVDTLTRLRASKHSCLQCGDKSIGSMSVR